MAHPFISAVYLEWRKEQGVWKLSDFGRFLVPVCLRLQFSRVSSICIYLQGKRQTDKVTLKTLYVWSHMCVYVGATANALQLLCSAMRCVSVIFDRPIIGSAWKAYFTWNPDWRWTLKRLDSPKIRSSSIKFRKWLLETSWSVFNIIYAIMFNVCHLSSCSTWNIFKYNV